MRKDLSSLLTTLTVGLMHNDNKGKFNFPLQENYIGYVKRPIALIIINRLAVISK